MKVLNSRTEVMDRVAGLVIGDSAEKARSTINGIKLALLHWNHVDDLSVPNTPFKGWDVSINTPVSSLNIKDLQEGAHEYQAGRIKEIQNNLMVNALNREGVQHMARMEIDFGSTHISRMSGLNDKRDELVNSLELLGVDTIDRLVTFNISPYECKVVGNNKELGSYIKNSLMLQNDDYEAGLHVDVIEISPNSNPDDYETQIQCFVSQSNAKKIVQDINDLVNSENNRDKFVTTQNTVSLHTEIETVPTTASYLINEREFLKEAKMRIGEDLNAQKEKAFDDDFSEMSM